MKRRRQKQIKGPRARHITEIPTQLLRPYKGCCGNWLCGYKICKDRRACSHQVVVQYLNMFFFKLLLLFMVCYTRGEARGVPFKTTDSHTWTGTKFRQMFNMFLCYFYILWFCYIPDHKNLASSFCSWFSFSVYLQYNTKAIAGFA